VLSDGVPVVICPSSSHELGSFEGGGTYLPDRRPMRPRSSKNV
jgi:hypothetical protein